MSLQRMSQALLPVWRPRQAFSSWTGLRLASRSESITKSHALCQVAQLARYVFALKCTKQCCNLSIFSPSSEVFAHYLWTGVLSRKTLHCTSCARLLSCYRVISTVSNAYYRVEVSSFSCWLKFFMSFSGTSDKDKIIAGGGKTLVLDSQKFGRLQLNDLQLLYLVVVSR